jgi:hypothetical protein
MGSGGLTKLRLLAFKDDKFSVAAAPGVIVLSINPASFSLSLGVCFNDVDAAGGTGEAKTFNRSFGATLTTEFIFDGTGAVPGAGDQDVAAQISDFRRALLDTNSETHSPNYVKLSWGKTLFKGRLKSLDIEYTLFNPDGSPLRARAKASFVGFQEKREARLAQNLNSPDLTHAVTVRPGDTLPLLCSRIYGDSIYYTKVAEANGLTGFRDLTPGTVLAFPPLSGTTS